MKSILHGDIVAAARVLRAIPNDLRRRICRRMFEEADVAHDHVLASGRIHQRYGDGSLMAVAHKREMVAEPSLHDIDYCSCLELVLHEVIRWKTFAVTN